MKFCELAIKKICFIFNFFFTFTNIITTRFYNYRTDETQILSKFSNTVISPVFSTPYSLIKRARDLGKGRKFVKKRGLWTTIRRGTNPTQAAAALAVCNLLRERITRTAKRATGTTTHANSRRGDLRINRQRAFSLALLFWVLHLFLLRGVQTIFQFRDESSFAETIFFFFFGR